MTYGLPSTTIEAIRGVFTKFSAIEKVVLYGSRAKGNYKRGSDIDLTLYGNNIPLSLCQIIAHELDALPIPYMIDLSIFDALDHVQLREHIERVGVVFYQSEKPDMRWETSTLSEECKIFSGNSINVKVKEKLYKNISLGTPYIATKDISYEGEIDYLNGVLIPEIEETKFRKAKKNCIFICAEGGSAGRKIAFSDRECFFVNKLFCLEAGLNVLPKYIYYFLKSESFQNQFKNALTGLIGGVSLSKIKSFVISFPPVCVQKQIVEKLDAAFADIDKAMSATQKNIKNAEALFTKFLLSKFDNCDGNWNKSTLKDIANKITDGSHNPPKGTEESDYLMLSSRNVFNGKLNFIKPRYLRKEDFINENKRTNIEEGDVLLTIVGTIGRSLVFPKTNKNITFQRSVAVIKPKKEIINAQFLMYFLISINDFLNKNAHGVAQQGIYLKALSQIEIMFPNYKSQKNLVTEFKLVNEKKDELIDLYSKKLNQLNSLKSSLLNQAFSGALTKEAA